jgi:hypothetical protein
MLGTFLDDEGKSHLIEISHMALYFEKNLGN